MFFTEGDDSSHIEFSLQKSDLDPVVTHFQLIIGDGVINDTHENNSFTHLQWPQPNVSLTITSLEGKKYTLTEEGIWAFFKLLQKVDVQSDNRDSSKLQILFEVNGHSGRYLLTTKNNINPFTPGILNDFNLGESIT